MNCDYYLLCGHEGVWPLPASGGDTVTMLTSVHDPQPHYHACLQQISSLASIMLCPEIRNFIGIRLLIS